MQNAIRYREGDEMSLGEIEKEVAEVVNKITGKEIVQNEYSTHFFSDKIGLTPFYLIYIFFALQEKYNIQFEREEILEEKLVSIKETAKAILGRV